jgi:hypothetical protein
MQCDDGICECGYLYALPPPTCVGLTAASGWSIGSRTATLIVSVACGCHIVRLLRRVPPRRDGGCTPSQAALWLMLIAMISLAAEMAYAVAFLAVMGLKLPVSWAVQRGVRNSLEGVAVSLGCLSGLMISLSWIDLILATRQLERISAARARRTRAGVWAFMIIFTVVTMVLNISRFSNPQRDSFVYRTLVINSAIAAAIVMCLFLFGACKVRRLT